MGNHLSYCKFKFVFYYENDIDVHSIVFKYGIWLYGVQIELVINVHYLNMQGLNSVLERSVIVLHFRKI